MNCLTSFNFPLYQVLVALTCMEEVTRTRCLGSGAMEEEEAAT